MESPVRLPGLFVLTALSTACQSKQDAQGLGETQSQTPTSATSTSGTSTSETSTSVISKTHPYQAFVGVEHYEEAINTAPNEPMDCRLVWQSSGSPISPHTCEGCEFVFDVDLVFDDWAESFAEDGSCGYTTGDPVDGALDSTIRYALQSSYYDLGAVILVGVESDYYAWAYANTSTEVLTYSRLLLQDLPYNGYYYTQRLYGSATIH